MWLINRELLDYCRGMAFTVSNPEYSGETMDREELEMLRPFKYVADLLRHGFIVRRRGGRGGIVTYSEVWRNARFEYEIRANGFGVYLKSSCWWRTLFGLPFQRLSDADKQRILSRLQQYDKYEGW